MRNRGTRKMTEPAPGHAASEPKNGKQPRLCMVVFSYYPADPRVRREAEALVEAGMAVDVVCLKGKDQPWTETVRGVGVCRLPIERRRGGKIRYLWEYASFVLLSCLVVAVLHLRKWYRAVHVHNMPDVLVFSALVPRLLGKKVILDLHDPMPEVFMAKYGMSETSRGIRLLRFLERLSIGFAHLVLTPNITFRNLFVSRGCPPGKIHVIMNSPQESVFLRERKEPPVEPAETAKPFTIMFHGTIVERHGLDTALEALTDLKDILPNLRFQVFGEGDFVEKFLSLVEGKHLENVVCYHGFVPLETISEAIPDIDLGLIPNKRSPFTEINMPTRIFEYLSLEKPVIAPRTRGVLDYFDEDSLFFFEPGNAQSLRETILLVYSDPVKRHEVLERGRKIYLKHRWESERTRLVGLVRSLLGLESSPPQPRPEEKR